jgi:RNA polymerase sigma-70 factor (ECF subfamily)
MAHAADRALARSLLSGDEREFDRFFNEYYPRLYRFVLTRADGDEALAQDLAQATLVNAVRALANYRGTASMFTWLCQICRNEMSAHFRRSGNAVDTVAADDESIRPLLEMLESDEDAAPDAVTERMQLIRLVQEVLDHLPGNYGNALEWKYIRGDSVEDIAERLEVTTLAAQSLLARARTAFRDALNTLAPRLVAHRR